MRTKFIAGITAAVITVAGLGVTAAYAKGNYDHAEKRMEHLAEKLNLTEAQETQLRAEMKEKQASMQDQRQARKDLRKQLMQLDPNATNYETQLNSLVLQAQEQAKASIIAKAEQQEALFEVLTPEQEKTFAELKMDMQNKMSKRMSGDRDERGHRGKGCH
jgi:protein CpxP